MGLPPSVLSSTSRSTSFLPIMPPDPVTRIFIACSFVCDSGDHRAGNGGTMREFAMQSAMLHRSVK